MGHGRDAFLSGLDHRAPLYFRRLRGVSATSGSFGTGTYQLLANSVSDDFAGDTSTTGRVTVGESVTGNVSENDADWFQVSLVAGTRYVMSLNGAITHNGTLADPWLELHDRNGALITWDDDSGIGSNAMVLSSPLRPIPITCQPRRFAAIRPAPIPCWSVSPAQGCPAGLISLMQRPAVGSDQAARARGQRLGF